MHSGIPSVKCDQYTGSAEPSLEGGQWTPSLTEGPDQVKQGPGSCLPDWALYWVGATTLHVPWASSLTADFAFSRSRTRGQEASASERVDPMGQKHSESSGPSSAGSAPWVHVEGPLLAPLIVSLLL